MSSTNSIRSQVEGELNVSTTPQVLQNPQIANFPVANPTTLIPITIPAAARAYELKMASNAQFKVRYQNDVNAAFLTAVLDCASGLTTATSILMYIQGGAPDGDVIQLRTWE